MNYRKSDYRRQSQLPQFKAAIEEAISHPETLWDFPRTDEFLIEKVEDN